MNVRDEDKVEVLASLFPQLMATLGETAADNDVTADDIIDFLPWVWPRSSTTIRT